MTTELQEVQSILEAKREEVVKRLRRLDEITVERAPDPIDEVDLISQRDSAITLLERDSELLRAIDTALEKIEKGEFGRCDLCGKEIAPRRLRAVPWATLCVACQEAADRSRVEEASAALMVEP